jgi:TetR/AcrR family transcriptional repressor of nem operon
MRYQPEHKAEVHQKIIEDASRRVRTEGLAGAAVSAVMRDTGLTHGGFYKHFRDKDELLIEALRKAFQEIADHLAQVAEQSKPGAGWKAIVEAYLSPEHCDHADWECPLAALGSELARADMGMKAQIFEELAKYKNRMLPFMPGRTSADKEPAFFAIFSTMIGAIELARMLPEPAIRLKVLESARDFLLRSF